MATTSNSTPTTDSPEMPGQYLAIGCALAICGNLLISVSLNLQKYTHVKNSEQENPKHYTRIPLWWLGVSLMIIGEIGNFSAYGYAPASLVAPLGTTTVVANMFLAAGILKEKIRPENLIGSALAIVGAILVVVFAPKKEKILDGQVLKEHLESTSFVIYIIIELTSLAGLFVLLYVYKMQRVVIYLLVVAIIASFSVISAKAVSSMVQLTFAGESQLKYISLYMMAIVMFSTAILQVKYLNMAMQRFESTIVVPTNFVFFTLSAIIAGIVFYNEFWGMTALDIFMFLFGCGMSFVGVYFIVAGKDSAAAVARAAKDEPDEGRSTPCSYAVAEKIFPSWLLATMNVGRVQPSGYTSHIVSEEDESRRPFVASDDNVSDSETELYVTADNSHAVNGVGSKRYGADE